MTAPFPLDVVDAANAQAAAVPCRHCGHTGAIRIEIRTELRANPPGAASLAGVAMKTTATEIGWPWAVCRPELGGCGHESRGQFDAG